MGAEANKFLVEARSLPRADARIAEAELISP